MGVHAERHREAPEHLRGGEERGELQSGGVHQPVHYDLQHVHAETAARLLPTAVRAIPRGVQRVHHHESPPRAARKTRRVHAERAREAVGQPQDHGPVALALLQLPRPVLHPTPQPRAAERRRHAVLPRPRLRGDQAHGQGRGAAAGGERARRRTGGSRADEEHLGHFRGDGHGRDGRVRERLRVPLTHEHRGVLRQEGDDLDRRRLVPGLPRESGGVPAQRERARRALPARELRDEDSEGVREGGSRAVRDAAAREGALRRGGLAPRRQDRGLGPNVPALQAHPRGVAPRRGHLQKVRRARGSDASQGGGGGGDAKEGGESRGGRGEGRVERRERVHGADVREERHRAPRQVPRVRGRLLQQRLAVPQGAEGGVRGVLQQGRRREHVRGAARDVLR
mmetsp:Transcript_11650/g.41953  ORF Transcript_11650/g.41953 Transcript_11650/m.41953 type:complete len:397 (+) Transcript_11650:235-1425(+)